MNLGNCLHCGKSLRGMRDDARYCSDSHKVLDYRKRLKIKVEKRLLVIKNV